jgi:hypothetical protein
MAYSTSYRDFLVKSDTKTGSGDHTLAASTLKVAKQNVGAVGVVIPTSFLTSHTIVVAPTTVDQTYTLPTASAILCQFGKSASGVPKLVAGDSLVLQVVNRGAFPAYIASNPVGGDGTTIIAYTGASAMVSGPSYRGTVVPSGKLTTLYLEWLEVNSSSVGSTGYYTVFA